MVRHINRLHGGIGNPVKEKLMPQAVLYGTSMLNLNLHPFLGSCAQMHFKQKKTLSICSMISSARSKK
jgi:hypothetical protein